MIELRRFEKTLKLRIDRKDPAKDLAKTGTEVQHQPKQSRRSRAQLDTNTLKTRTLTRLPGEVFA
jgi:hypothetical protein